MDGETAACWAPSHCFIPVLWPTLLPRLLPSSIDRTIICRQPRNCHHPGCFPLLPTLLLSAIDTHVLIAHVVVTHVVICHCRHRRRRCHDRSFRHYCCRFLADCCLRTLPNALPAAPPLSFVTSFDDVVLPQWALALDDANSCQANARQSLGCCRPPPLASNPASGNGFFASLLSSLLSPALATAAAE